LLFAAIYVGLTYKELKDFFFYIVSASALAKPERST